MYQISKKYIEDEIARQKKEVERRVSAYRKGKKMPDLKGKTIILIDDGVATGATIKAAISALKIEEIEKIGCCPSCLSS